MNSKYRKYKNTLNDKHVADIVSISKLAGIPQKTIYSALNIYYKYTKASSRYEDIVSVGAACIMLSGKICGSIRSLEQILRASYSYYKLEVQDVSFEQNYNNAIETELRICIALDFNFKIKDVYGYLERMCIEHNISKSMAQTIWIALNDSMYLPLTLVFCTKNIVLGCILISSIINNKSESDIGQPRLTLGKIDLDDPDICFISEEIISLYENALNGTFKISQVEKNLEI